MPRYTTSSRTCSILEQQQAASRREGMPLFPVVLSYPNELGNSNEAGLTELARGQVLSPKVDSLDSLNRTGGLLFFQMFPF
jgi:hypothetical protein